MHKTPLHKVITIDGPAGAGKGTIARLLATEFKYAYLDTGLLYRAVASVCLSKKINPQDALAATTIAENLSPEDVERSDLRSEIVTAAASIIAAHTGVRQALLAFQQSFASTPPQDKQGVVLDGRDTGTVIYPQASCKLFLTASAEERAQRRLRELQEKGEKVEFLKVLQGLQERDNRDSNRPDAPLKPAKNALIIDTTQKSVCDVFTEAKQYARDCGL